MVVGDVTTGTDVLIIGAGPGGYVAAIRAGQLDLDVTLVEKADLGGICLNHGCIPSKALITATGIAHDAANAEELGVHADPAIDFAQMMDWKADVVDQLTGGVGKLCKANGVNVIEGTAVFEDEHSARISHSGEGQGSETIEFEHAIIATGSEPIEIPGFSYDDEPVLSSREALQLESVPDELVVVGAGYIGMELATVYAKAGSDVTVVEMLDSMLPQYPDDLTRPVKQHARSLDIDFEFEQTATEWEPHGNTYAVQTEPAQGADDVEGTTLTADKIMVAVGRQPLTDTVNLDAIGIEPNEDGFIDVDDRARTDLEHIYAIGDVVGEPMLAHKASKEGEVAIEHIAGEPVALDYQAMPAVVFTDPEIATVGMTEDEAEENGYEPLVGEFPFRASGRALTADETDGSVKIVADEESGFVLGGQIVGPEASELIAEIGLAIEMGATVEDIGSTVHTHPTLSESVMEAAENALEKAIHTLNR
jgi:dihydrolipoamide dehydrogenase